MRQDDLPSPLSKLLLRLLELLCRLLTYSTGQRDAAGTPIEQRLRDHSCLLVILGISRFHNPSERG